MRTLLSMFFLILLGMLIHSTSSLANEDDETAIKLIECCRWTEAAALYDTGANPFGSVTGKNPINVKLFSCYNKVVDNAWAYDYEWHSEKNRNAIYRIFKATILHPEFSKNRHNLGTRNGLDRFVASLLRDFTPEHYELVLEMSKRNLIHFLAFDYTFFSARDKALSLKFFEDYISRGGNPRACALMSDYGDCGNDSLITVAANYGHFPIVNLLISLGIKVTGPEALNWLYWQILINGEERTANANEIVNNLNLLLENGANADNILSKLFYFSYSNRQDRIQDRNICDPVNNHGINTRLAIMNLLIAKYHVPIDFKDESGNYFASNIINNISTSLDRYSAYNTNLGFCHNLKPIISMMELLFDNGYDFNWQNANGATVLHEAVAHLWPLEMIEFLLQKNANKNIKDKWGLTPVKWCNTKYALEHCTKVQKIMRKY